MITILQKLNILPSSNGIRPLVQVLKEEQHPQAVAISNTVMPINMGMDEWMDNNWAKFQNSNN